MSAIRRYRGATGILVVCFLLFGGGFAEAAVALQGPQPQFPLCTPDGPKHSGTAPDRANLSDHCDICPLAAGASDVPALAGIFTAPVYSGVLVPARGLSAAESGIRPELWPLRGRAPPFGTGTEHVS